MGDGYKNYCKQVGGVYLNGEDLRFNPFIGVRNIDESAEGISRLLAVLASPQNPLDDVCEAILLKAVISAYERKKNEALIDDVHAYLTSVEITREYEQKPTIIARLAELALLLDAYCTWGTYGEYFNSPKPTLDGETRFAVLELLSLEDKPKLLSAILFSLILSIQQKCTTAREASKKWPLSMKPGVCSVAPTRTQRSLSKQATVPSVATVVGLLPSLRVLKTSRPGKRPKQPGITVQPKSRFCRMQKPLNSISPNIQTSSRRWKKTLSSISSPRLIPDSVLC
jgi:hypothetical protein